VIGYAVPTMFWTWVAQARSLLSVSHWRLDRTGVVHRPGDDLDHTVRWDNPSERIRSQVCLHRQGAKTVVGFDASAALGELLVVANT